MADYGSPWDSDKSKSFGDVFATRPHENTYRYDRDGIDANDAESLEQTAGDIVRCKAELRRKVAKDIIEIGELLDSAHKILARHKNGVWGRWVEERCGISRSTAYRYMTIHREWGNCVTLTQNAELTALWQVAQDRTAAAEAKRMLGNGDRLDSELARRLLEAHSPRHQGIAAKRAADERRREIQWREGLQKITLDEPDEPEQGLAAAEPDKPEPDAAPPEPIRCKCCGVELSRGRKGPYCGQCRRYANSPTMQDMATDAGIPADDAEPGDTATINHEAGEDIQEDIQARWDNTRKPIADPDPDEDYGRYTFLDLVDDTPLEPTNYWQGATEYDERDWQDDICSLVVYWWRLATAGKSKGHRVQSITEMLHQLGRMIDEEGKERHRRNSQR